jgi:hypothetical protein
VACGEWARKHMKEGWRCEPAPWLFRLYLTISVQLMG